MTWAWNVCADSSDNHRKYGKQELNWTQPENVETFLEKLIEKSELCQNYIVPKLIVVLRNKLEIAIDGNYVQKVSITFLYPEAAREGRTG